MKLYIKYCMEIILLTIISAKCQHIVLTGSHLLSTDLNYKAFLSVNNIKNSAITVALKEGGGSKLIDKVSLTGNETFKVIEFKTSSLTHPVYELEVIQKSQNSCTRQSANIINMSNRPLIFIQTNKASYLTGDDFKFQIFILNQKFIPIKSKPISVEIRDSKGNQIRKYLNAKTSKFGSFEGAVKIAETPNLGTWALQVEINGRKKMRKFEIKKVVEDFLQVDVIVSKEVRFSDKKIDMSLKAKRTFNKFFQGFAKVTAITKTFDGETVMPSQVIREVPLSNLGERIQIDIENDLKINSIKSDLKVSFVIEITDNSSAEKKKLSAETIIKNNMEEDISVLRHKYFRPGIKFPITVKIKNFGSDSENFHNLMSYQIDYHNRDVVTNKESVETKQSSIALKKAITKFELSPQIDTFKIDLNYKYGKSVHSATILTPKSLCNDEFILALFTKVGNNVNDEFRIKVEGSSNLANLNVLVISHEGVVHNQFYEINPPNKKFIFSFKLTEKMKPKFNIIIYYIRPEDGQIVFDSLPFDFGYSTDESLVLNLEDQPKFNNPFSIIVKSPTDSKIFLNANDQYSEQSNLISKTIIEKELTAFMSFKFFNDSIFDFQGFNFFSLKPSTSVQCDAPSSKSATTLDRFEDDDHENEVLERMFIPEVLFDEAIESGKSKILSIKQVLPHSLTSWSIHGIAVDPSEGLKLTKPGFEIRTNEKFDFKIHAPSSAKQYEVFLVEYNILSFFNETAKVPVTVTIENGHFMSETQNNRYKCREYSISNSSPKPKVDTNPNAASKTLNFLIRSDSIGQMKLKFTLQHGEYIRETLKTIEIENSENLQNVDYKSTFLDSAGYYQDTKEITKQASHLKIFGNLLGPEVNGLNKIYGNRWDWNEYKIDKLASSISGYKYLKLIKASESDIGKRKLDEIMQDYQDVLAVANSVLASLTYDSIKPLSDIANVLISLRDIMEVDEGILNKCLEFIAKQQNPQGDFSYEMNSNAFEILGETNVRAYIFSAMVISPLIRHENSKKSYKRQIDLSFKYLRSKLENMDNDYEKSVVAYISALNGDSQTYDSFMQGIDSVGSTPSVNQKSLYVETASYLILAKVLSRQDAKKEVEWLLNMRNPDGSFASPHDTSLAVEALYEYTKYRKPGTPKIRFNVQGMTKQMTNYLDELHFDLSPTGTVYLIGNGNGFGYSTFFSTITELTSSKENKFIIKSEVKEVAAKEIEIKVDVSIELQNIKELKVIVIEVELPKGYKYMRHNSNNNIVKTDLKIENTLVLFYMTKFKKNMLNHSVTIRATMQYDFRVSQKSLIKVYDYYQRESIGSTLYNYEMGSQKKQLCSVHISNYNGNISFDFFKNKTQ